MMRHAKCLRDPLTQPPPLPWKRALRKRVTATNVVLVLRTGIGPKRSYQPHTDNSTAYCRNLLYVINKQTHLDNTCIPLFIAGITLDCIIHFQYNDGI